jgi:uncharacterized protein involved in exopolysaccharide biosynthesis
VLARALRKHRVAALLTFLLVLGAAAAYAAFTPDRYEAEARLLVTPPTDALIGELGLVDTPETVAELVLSPQVAERVAIRLRLDDAAAARDAVEAGQAGTSDVVVVRAHHEHALTAAQIANAFADETVRQLSGRFQTAVSRELERLRERLLDVPATERVDLRDRIARLRALQGERDPGVEVLGSALAPSEPSWPKPALILGVGAAAALLLALLVALALEWDPRRRAAPVAEAPGSPAPRRRRDDIRELERLLEKRGKRVPDRRLEWEAYLEELRARADDGELPPALQRLADEVFADLRAA